MNTVVEQAVRRAAITNKIPEAALLAVFEVESAGVAFWNVDGKQLPAIRFEGHYFHKRLTGQNLNLAVQQGLANTKVGGVKNPSNYSQRYALLERARKIDRDAADESTSWGLGQVMGANWKALGYRSVGELVQAAQTVEGQVDMVVRFLDTNNLIPALKAHRWADFARAYNGKSYKRNKYDEKLEEAYKKYSGQTNTSDKAAVMQIQTMLNKVGDYKLALDGVSGDATRAAIRDFQIRNGLVVDGIYGPITRETLEARYRLALSEGETQVGGLTGAVGAAGTAVTEAIKAIEPLAKTSTLLQIVFVGLILLGVGLAVKGVFFKGKA